MLNNKIITIDGPSGVGKTTIATLVAEKLDLPVVPSGRLFRAAAWVLARQNVSLEDQELVEERVPAIMFDMTPSGDILYEGSDITSHIAGSAIGIAASTIAPYPEVRRRMLELQRHLGEKHGCVVEGRSTGIEVFPHAALKIWLTAGLAVRVTWVTEKYGEVAARTIQERDEVDESRTNAPMRKADDALEIDSTHMSTDEVVAKIVSLYTSL